MRTAVCLLSGVIGVVLIGAAASDHVWDKTRDRQSRPKPTSLGDEGALERGRWGELDELGAANLITPDAVAATAFSRDGLRLASLSLVDNIQILIGRLDRTSEELSRYGAAGATPVPSKELFLCVEEVAREPDTSEFGACSD